MARRDVLHSKAEYIAADLSIAPKLSLAVLRRTIHFRDLVGRIFLNKSTRCDILRQDLRSRNAVFGNYEELVTFPSSSIGRVS
jgi:hypothetical protein